MTTGLPVIVSLEVHTCMEQQQVMVDIMEEYWKDMLVELPPDPTDNTPLPRLQDLLFKILIKAKYSPKPDPAEAEPTPASKVPTKNSDTSSSSDDETVEKRKRKAPKARMHEALSRLSVYTRSYHFKSFDQPGK